MSEQEEFDTKKGRYAPLEDQIENLQSIIDQQAERNAELEAELAAANKRYEDAFREPTATCRLSDLTNLDAEGKSIYVFKGETPFADWVYVFTKPEGET